jgi:hypothetical protein
MCTFVSASFVTKTANVIVGLEGYTQILRCFTDLVTVNVTK